MHQVSKESAIHLWVTFLVRTKQIETVYIGQTKRKLRVRLKEHFNSVAKKNMCSALAYHAIDEGHEFDFEAPRILCREENLTKREFLESHYIIKNKNSVNFRCEKESVSLIYSNILADLKLWYNNYDLLVNPNIPKKTSIAILQLSLVKV